MKKIKINEMELSFVITSSISFIVQSKLILLRIKILKLTATGIKCI
ncbi:hypothetical protein [uncultured Brachyspira sp.]|nr:hypothetical protein [uncultured Brachyspira sp.]